MVETGETSLDSTAYAWVFWAERWVVALEKSCGLVGAVECDVEGRESRPSCGRGGSGGGVSSLDTSELVDVLREILCIMLSVGFAKSCCSIWSAFFELRETLLLCCVGVVGELSPSEAGV
jgi:hypothetical protein